MTAPTDPRATAVRVLTQAGATDVIEALGLTDVVIQCPTCKQDIDRRPKCPGCGKPYAPGYRVCRRAPCSLGPKARGVRR